MRKLVFLALFSLLAVSARADEGLVPFYHIPHPLIVNASPPLVQRLDAIMARLNQCAPDYGNILRSNTKAIVVVEGISNSSARTQERMIVFARHKYFDNLASMQYQDLFAMVDLVHEARHLMLQGGDEKTVTAFTLPLLDLCPIEDRDFPLLRQQLTNASK